MSAPQTNLERQKQRHRGPLIGISIVLLFVLLFVFFWSGAKPPPADAVGAPVVTAPAAAPTTSTTP